MKKLLLLLTVFLFTSLVFAGKVVTKKDSLLQVSGTDSIWQIAKGTSAQFVTDKGTFRFNKIITIAGDTVITYSTLEDSLGAYVDTLTNQNIYGEKVFYGTVIAPSIKMTTLYNDSGLVLISNDNTTTTISRGDTTFITMADTTLTVSKNLVSTAKTANTPNAITIATSSTTFVMTRNVAVITGDALGNTVSTITGGMAGQVITLIFVDGLVTITDTDTATANTVNLSATFTSAANTTLTLVFNGTKWLEVSRSVNG